MQKTKIRIKDKPLMPMKRLRVLMVTPKKVALIIFIVFVVLVLGYFWREINFLIRPPKLEITQPPTDISTNQSTIEIIGKTESTAILTIDGYNAYINKDGSFKFEKNLSEGVNNVIIESKNRFNKINTIIRRIIYNK
ncbi:MAG: hypothetical protein V1686_01120 [Patescibacteria group bacterium]